MKKLNFSIGTNVIYAAMGLAFILIVSLNIYAYIAIASMGTEYAEIGSASKSFLLEYQNAVTTIREIVVLKNTTKTFEKGVWDRIDAADQYVKQLTRLRKEMKPLEKNLNDFREACNSVKSAKPEKLEDALKRCSKLYTDAEGSVKGVESGVKAQIDNRMMFVRFVYIVLILFIVVTFFGIFMAIFLSERQYKKRAKSLEGRFANLNALVQGFDSIIFSIDNKGLVKTWNHNAERYFEKKSEEVLNANVYELLPYFSGFKPIFDSAIYSGKRTYRYHELLSINRGPLRALNILCVPITSMEHEKGYSELLVKIDDLTSFSLDDDRRTLQQKIGAMYSLLESVERDSAPMMETIGNSMETVNSIAAECGRENEVLPYTAYMRNMLAQIGILPQLYMSTVAGTSFSKTQIDLNEMIMYVLRICQKTFDSRVSIEVSLNETRSWVLANPIRLFYAFLNIIRNAEESMLSMRKEGEEMGGILSVSVEKIPSERVNIDKIVRYRQAFEDEPAYWIVLFSDTGVGMTPEVKAKAFDPFYTTKDKMEHKGLGLSITANIIDELNGNVDINSQPGRGTVFKLFLPESKDSIKGDGSVSDSLNMDEDKIIKGTGSLLLVIDDHLLCDTMTKLFRKLGYDPIPAGNGFQAANIYAQRAAEIKGVILDISTKYMTAADTYFQLQAINPDVKVIVAQSYDRDEAIMKLKKSGFTNFIQKPYPIDMISRKIADFG